MNTGKNTYIMNIKIFQESNTMPFIESSRSNDTNGFLRELVSEALGYMYLEKSDCFFKT